MSKLLFEEPIPIAMDALPPEMRGRRRVISKHPVTMDRSSHRIEGNRRKTAMGSRMAIDADTAMEDGQWGELTKFLKTKLSDGDLATVEGICRRGESAPNAPAAADIARRPNARVAYNDQSYPDRNRLKL